LDWREGGFTAKILAPLLSAPDTTLSITVKVTHENADNDYPNFVSSQECTLFTAAEGGSCPYV